MNTRSLWASLIGIVAVAILGLVLTFAVGNKPALGLDLQGGASVVLQPKEGSDSTAIDTAIDIIRNRVDGLGVAEPEITRQGDAVVVNLPGVKDQDRALEVVGQTAELRFRPVLESLAPDDADAETGTSTTVPGATTTAAGATTTAAGATTTAAGAATTAASAATTAASASTVPGATTVPATTVPGATTTVPSTIVPTTPAEQDDPTKEVVLRELDDDGNVVLRYRMGPAFLTGSALTGASKVFQGNEWQVKVDLKDGQDGIGTWNVWAAKCFNREADCPSGQLAIVLDGNVVSAPTLQTGSFPDNTVVITGGGNGFKESEAGDLALVLRYGSLPVELVPQAVQTVSATLGEDSLHAGIAAGLVGLALVVAFMILYYRGLGLVVMAGLAVTAALLWTVVAYLGENNGLALSLAGATGIIVSIGVTVDSYVVYFERLKDDVRAGKSLRSASTKSFSSAYRTILAADVVSLIGAGILWWLTVGAVRGFAFFLGLSALLDIIVAYFFTRPAVILLSRSRFYAGKDKVLGVTTGEAAVDKKVLVGATK
jgi:preprotein translocase subunit SecD